MVQQGRPLPVVLFSVVPMYDVLQQKKLFGHPLRFSRVGWGDEMLFTTVFSTTFSTIFSTIFENILPFRPTIDHTTNCIQDTLHSSFVSKNICALHRRSFQKLPLLTTFLPVFTVDEVCYISNKHQPSNHLAKYQYFYTETLYPSFISKKTGVLNREHFPKHSLFTTFSLSLTVSEVRNISNKC